MLLLDLAHEVLGGSAMQYNSFAHLHFDMYSDVDMMPLLLLLGHDRILSQVCSAPNSTIFTLFNFFAGFTLHFSFFILLTGFTCLH